MQLFVLPFGLQAAGGGSRIFRALLENVPEPVVCVATCPSKPPPLSIGGGRVTEAHLPLRPWMGRLERGRFLRLWTPWDKRMDGRLTRRLLQFANGHEVEAVHALAHTMDFWNAYTVAQAKNVPFFLTAHDDILVTMPPSRRDEGTEKLGIVWKNAHERFVISEEIGDEYNKRFGERSYVQVTDGVTHVPDAPRAFRAGELHLYLAGLFHFGYTDNLNALLLALQRLKADHPQWNLSVTMRCGSLPHQVRRDVFPVNVLPFGSEADVARDLEDKTVLYLPLQFEDDHANFVRFSLSTKMVTYLGSGLPILYHGPEEAAAGKLLARQKAAFSMTSVHVPEIQAVLQDMATQEALSQSMVRNALALARSRFSLNDIRERFWSATRLRHNRSPEEQSGARQTLRYDALGL